MKMLFHRYVCYLACLLTFVAVLAGAAAPTQAASKLVRVGWYQDVYNITGRHGERSGYVYELEQAVAAYTDWKYEYVTGTWPELMQKIENGEIDLMASVSSTPERERTMLFSELPMGKEIYYLYADLKHTDISPGDITSLNGKRIGILTDSVQYPILLSWEQKHGLHFTKVEVKNFDDAREKLDKREIDAVSSIETPDWVNVGTSPVATTGTSGIYFAINKKRPDLKLELDNAMHKMEYDKPFYMDELYKRYLTSVSNAVLSQEEQAWLTQHGAIRVGYLQQDFGVSSLDEKTGKLVGVINDYLKYAADCLGEHTLQFTAQGFATQEEQLQALQDGKIDMIFHVSQNPYAGEQNDFIFSNTVFSSNMAAVTQKDYFDENAVNTVATEKGNLLLKWYVGYNYPQWKVKEYATGAELEAAVRRGEADCFIVKSGQLSKNMESNGLHSVFLTRAGNTSFAVSRGNVLLLSILNKTLKTMPPSMLAGALSMYDNRLKKVTAMDFVKDNLIAVATVFMSIVLVIFLIILGLLQKSRRAEAKAKLAASEASELNVRLQESQEELEAALLRAQAANAAKTTFLSNVSHDIRTPMNAIVGLTQLMGDALQVPERLHDYLDKLNASSHHLLNLINDILDMSKIESGKTTINVVPFSLSEQLTQLESVMRPQARARKQELTVTTHNLQHEYVLGDATKLQQVLQNLLSNAVKYTDEGGRIALDIAEMPRSGHYARYKFSVTDNGMGMSKEFQKHVYEPFARAESSLTNKVQGTGLGMAITKSIVDMMGGSILLTSELGQGTCFEVMLEFKVNEETESDVEKQQEQDKFSLQGMRFLCAEDNKLNAEILAAILQMKGASSCICHNGEEIVERFKTVQPDEFDAILMDIQMPSMSGYEATSAIRNGANPLGRTIPIIAMTANAFAEDVQKSYDAGMNAHLSKPVDIAVLEQTLRRFRNS